MKLSPAVERYVLHWGEMGTRWGTNRSVAQIQALLYLSPGPLRADEIVELLSLARSNVSTGLRELQSYGLVRMTHVLGDRRDYFE
ncbi:MAG: MarR family transcriptional regulator, partial [Woeseiaceae bacterium]|nr:MarR family transcriptional regulator [Woeseiaceae bacterium]